MHGWGIQIASDVIRDGLGAELIDRRGNVVAELFRCDANNTVFLNTFNNEIPLEAVEWFLAASRKRLPPFEDGTQFLALPQT